MKTANKFTICDLRLTIGNRSRAVALIPAADPRPGAFPAASIRQSSIGNRKSQAGVALVITLIMLSVTLVMAIAFLALAKRERSSVSTATDTAVARLAADSALANAQAQIAANLLAGLANGVSNGAYNLHLLVSTNCDTNVATAWFLPRAPVFVSTNPSIPGYDFRFYLDLNENGAFEPNGWITNVDASGNILLDPSNNPVVTLQPGDPEWVGVLEHPDTPHGPNNHFISRYAFIAVPSGNALDLNYLHNEARNQTATVPDVDSFMRNQGVGSWELNLAAFLADLNTNQWDNPLQPYQYNEPNSVNSGFAFSDACALLAYRYHYNPLATASSAFANAGIIPSLPMDIYSAGPLQTALDYNNLPNGNPYLISWSGADNPNHFFTPGDFFDTTKTAINVSPAFVAAGNDFTDRLKAAGNGVATYDRYTFYRMLDQLGSDSSPQDGRLNLNFSNAMVAYTNVGGASVPISISIIPGAETNLVPWQPLDFFLAASDQMLRLYSSNWWSANHAAFTNNFAVTAPFSVTNIPVWVSNRFVYTPAVNRLLQLAANIYDASTSGNNNLPHVFRPLFRRVNTGVNNDIYIMGYAPVTSVGGPGSSQLASPYDVTQLLGATQTPISDGNGPVNVYGVPWIIGAKKNLPAFNQLYLTNAVQVTRQLMFGKTAGAKGASPFNPGSPFTPSQRFIMAFNTGLGVSFWNPYTNVYTPRAGSSLTVYAKDAIYTTLTASNYSWPTNYSFYLGNSAAGISLNSWPGTSWYGTAVLNPGSAFTNGSWGMSFPASPAVYRFNLPGFEPVWSPTASTWETTTPALPQLPNFGLAITNYLQAYILDGTNVIDYVQLRDPNTFTNLGAAMADPNGGGATYPQWSTNGYPLSNTSGTPSYGVYDQYYVSSHPGSVPPGSGAWLLPQSFLPSDWLGLVNANNSAAVEAAFFNAFFTPDGKFTYNGANYFNTQTQIQAPYTPTRTVMATFLLQANDPLVHYLASDLNSQVGATAVWGNGTIWQNGVWKHIDDMAVSAMPTPPATPIGGRYQPWGWVGSALPDTASATTGGDASGFNLAYKDPLATQPDSWDFPTSPYPTPGWLGRVHRGTPWQTVYLKSTDITGQNVNWWANWTGDIALDLGQSYDASNSAPVQDRLLFDLFTTRLNDNSVRGTLPVNQNNLAAWSALFSGMTALSNSAANLDLTTPLTFNSLIINPAGVDQANSPLWQLVNGVNGINATRANTSLFTNQSFVHVGDILQTPALTEQSPFLNLGTNGALFPQTHYGINDEEYEWLPQQMMGLLRPTEARYVLYCYGQTLHPAPNGTVLLSGANFQLVTNYQVVAESVVRAVVRIDNANTAHPRAVVESYNVLPPN